MRIGNVGRNAHRVADRSTVLVSEECHAEQALGSGECQGLPGDPYPGRGGHPDAWIGSNRPVYKDGWEGPRDPVGAENLIRGADLGVSV